MKKKYQPKLPLWDTQKTGLARMQGREFFALTMAMRTGKSSTILAEFGQLVLDGKVKDMLLIAPAGVYRTWLDAMRDHLSDDLASRLRVHTWRSGAGRAEKNLLKYFLFQRDEPRILLMNCEAISRAGEARKICIEFLTQNKNYVVIDESTIIKNKSKRTDFVNNSVRQYATYRRILSGLPTPRSPLDLYYQFLFLDWKILGHKSWYTFRESIAHMKQQYLGGRSVIVIDTEKGQKGFRPEAIANLQRLIAPHSYRVEFRPKVPSTYTIREVEMTKEQAKAYNEMKEFATTQLSKESHASASVVIAQIMKLHQILMGHVLDENGNEHFIPENRTAALMELLEDISGKVVIWFTYITDLNRVSEVIEKEHGPGSIAKFCGDNISTREADEKRFKDDPNCWVMAATAGAGGRGRTWANADTVIYFSSSDDLEKREQSEQRAHARDKEIGVDYIDLICPGTVEEKILQALRNKINVSSAIMGDGWKNWIV